MSIAFKLLGPSASMGNPSAFLLVTACFYACMVGRREHERSSMGPKSGSCDSPQALSQRFITPVHPVHVTVLYFCIDCPCFALLVQLAITMTAFMSVPRPLPRDAPQELFSEGRAMQHVKHLADTIGERVVSTAGEEASAQYLLAEAEKLVALAEQRPDLLVEADREQVGMWSVCEWAVCVCERKWVDVCRAQNDGDVF